MLNLGEMVMYGTTGVCIVEKIEERKIGKEVKSYYVLKPVAQASATVFLPADNETLLLKAREVLTADEVKTIIGEVLNEPDIWVESDGERKLRFSEIISSGDRKEFLLLLRTLYNRQKFLSDKGKRLHLSDERFLKESQRLVFDEFSIALSIGLDDIGMFIKKELKLVD